MNVRVFESVPSESSSSWKLDGLRPPPVVKLKSCASFGCACLTTVTLPCCWCVNVQVTVSPAATLMFEAGLPSSQVADARSQPDGGDCEIPNIDVVRRICALLDKARPRAKGRYADLITFVADRPGHDRRYAIDSSKVGAELGWRPQETFDSGLQKTVRWYLENEQWVADVTSGAYRTWVDANYAKRGAA